MSQTTTQDSARYFHPNLGNSFGQCNYRLRVFGPTINYSFVIRGWAVSFVQPLTTFAYDCLDLGLFFHPS